MRTYQEEHLKAPLPLVAALERLEFLVRFASARHEPLGLSDFDDTGLTMEALAVIEVGSEAGTGDANPAALYTKEGFMNPDAVPASGRFVSGDLTPWQ